MKKSTYLASILIFIFSSVAALGEERCSDVLIANVSTSKSSFSDYLSYVSMIDEKNYVEASKKVSAGFEFFDLLDTSGDYSKFNKSRNTLFKKLNFDSSKSQSTNALSSTIPEVAFDAYRDCMANRFGFHGVLGKVTNSYVRVFFAYKSDARTTKNLFLDPGLDTIQEISSVKMSSSEWIISPGDWVAVRISRNPARDFSVVAKIAEFKPVEISVDADDQIPPPEGSHECFFIYHEIGDQQKICFNLSKANCGLSYYADGDIPKSTLTSTQCSPSTVSFDATRVPSGVNYYWNVTFSFPEKSRKYIVGKAIDSTNRRFHYVGRRIQ